MAKAKESTSNSIYRERRSFAKIQDVMDLPNLIGIQTDSFEWFKTEGIEQAFQDIGPIESNSKDMTLTYVSHSLTVYCGSSNEWLT